jgi:hypothetical protein
MAFYNLAVYSKLYLETENEEWSAIPTSSLLHRIHNSDQTTVRWIAVIHYKGTEFHIALGDPIRDTAQAMFVPGWFLHQMGVIGDGEEMEVSFIPAETIPKASRLHFSLIGDRSTIPEGVEIRDLLETPLSQLGVISKGQTIPIPVLENHSLLVKECDPAETVFLDGAEIAFEMESESESESNASRRQDTPWVSPLAQTPNVTPNLTANQNLFDGPMISSIVTPATFSNTLIANSRTSTRRQFIPFQGNGRTLSEM